MNNRHINKTLRNALDLPLEDSTQLVAMLLMRHCLDKGVKEEEVTVTLDNGLSMEIKFKVNGLED